MKRTNLLKAFIAMLFCTIAAMTGVQAQNSYTFSDYPAGVQYAENEEHVLDDVLTLYTTQCHFTTQLRVYSSSTHNGFFHSNAQPFYIESLSFNMYCSNSNAEDDVNIYGSTDGNNWTLVGDIPVTSSASNLSISFGNSNYNYFKFDVAGNQQVRVTSMTITYKSTGPGLTTQIPTFNPAAGIYTEPFNVTLSCNTEGSSIYYTLNGSTPDSTSTLYTTPIPVNQNTTIKAIAYSTGANHSPVATATYTFPIEVANIAAFKAANTATNTTPYKITGDVTFVYENGANIYVQDATGGLLIYNSSNIISNNYTEGDVISGGVYGTYTLYNGLVELVPVMNMAAASSNTGAITPIVATLEDIATNYDQYESKLVKLQNVTFTEGGTFTTTSTTNMEIAQNGDTMQVRNNFKTLDTTIAAGSQTDVTGFVLRYYNNFQIAPRTNADLTTDVTLPSIAITSPANGATLSTLDTLHVELDIQNFTLGTDGLLKVESDLLTMAGLSNPTYFNAITWAVFQNIVLSPLPVGTFTATVSLVDINQQPLTPAASATTTITVVAPQLDAPIITVTGEPEGSANTYYLTANVTIAAETGAEIRYTTDGTTPTEASTLYTAPFDVTTTSTIKAMAVRANYANSEVATTEVIIAIPTVATPTFTPATGTYADSVTFSLACTTEGATIRYTTDGNEPTEESAIYSTPVTLTANATVKAKAFVQNRNASATATAVYTIAHEPALAVSTEALNFSSSVLTQTFDVTSAFLTAPVTLSCNNEHFTLSQDTIPATTTATTITVTFDGTESATGLITISSDTLSAQIALTATALLATPVITPETGTTDTAITVSIACANMQATVYYTTDGTTPDNSANVYTAPFTLSTPGSYTINAIAMQEGWETSAMATANYTVVAPVIPSTLVDTLAYYTGFESTEGYTISTVYNQLAEVLNGPADGQWAISYGTVATNSSICDSSSLQMRWYTSAVDNIGYARSTFDVTHATRITFKAKSTGDLNAIVSYSTDGGNTYVDSLFEMTTLARDYELIISETAEYDNVRFKFAIALPETAPTANSKLIIDSLCVFNFPSLVVHTAEMPIISPNGGNVFEPTTVTITCATEDANIYYTLDGSTPDANATLYTAPFEVTTTTTVKAIAIKAGYTNSNVATATYTFPIEVATIAAFKEANSATNTTPYKITGDVTFVYENGRNMYIQDATGGLLIYDNNNMISTTYTEGDVISGGVFGTYTLYNGLVEMVPIANLAEADTNIGAITPVVATVEEIAAFYYQYESKLVKLEGVTFTESGIFSTESATNLDIEQNGETMQVRNNFKTLDMTINAGYQADVVGFVLQYNGNYQIAPRDNSDIIGQTVEMDTVATPEITVDRLTNDMYAVTITCSTPEATIYYTTDGTEPTADANAYTNTFTTEGGTTIKAIAIAEGMANSATATYTNVGISNYAANTTIYPNPTDGQVTIHNADCTIQNVLVYDAFGRLLENVSVNDFSANINLSAYATGTYFLRIMTDSGMIVKTVIRK